MSQLKEFFECIDSDTLIRPGITFFSSHTYPLLFFSLVLGRLKKNKALQIIDVVATSHEELQAQVATSFLGAHQLYFLKNIHLLAEQKKKKLLAFCASYKGPHTLLCFSLDDDSSPFKALGVQVLTLPQEIGYHEYTDLISYLMPQRQSASFSQALFSRTKTIALDTACLLSYYHATLGRGTRAFFLNWADTLFAQQSSLFTLSGYLFAKNTRAFLHLNEQCRADYPPEFWIAFWSQQLWQASIFVDFARRKKMLEGRKFANRLPFMFLQKDWRRYRYEELTAAHRFLYMVDYSIKNGGQPFSLDLFYFKFLAGQFS